MTEIKIEKRKPVWPWVLAGILVLAIVGYFIMADDDNSRDRWDNNRTETGAYNDNTTNREGDWNDGNDRADNMNNRSGDRDNKIFDNNNNNRTDARTPAVANYVNYVKNDLDRNDLNNQTISQAFRQLSEATSAVASKTGYNANKSLDNIKQDINNLGNESLDRARAANIRKTADMVTNELVKIQQNHFPRLEGEAENLAGASSSIKPDELAQDQRGNIKDFLTEAADLLEKMDSDDERNR